MLAAHLMWARVGSAWGSAGHAIDRAGRFGVIVHLWYTPAKFTWPGQLPRASPDRSARGHQRRAGLGEASRQWLSGRTRGDGSAAEPAARSALGPARPCAVLPTIRRNRVRHRTRLAAGARQ